MNPACSTGPVVFVGGRALAQLWVFWGAIAGAAVASWVHKGLLDVRDGPDIAGLR